MGYRGPLTLASSVTEAATPALSNMAEPSEPKNYKIWVEHGERKKKGPQRRTASGEVRILVQTIT